MVVRILLCDDFDGILPSDIPSYPWMFQKLFDSVRTGLEYRVYPVYAGVLPEAASAGAEDLFLVTGSRAGAYEGLPWIEALAVFIREADAKRLLLAGVCFGHQIIAQALGGRVEKSPEGLIAGVRTARRSTADPLFSGEAFNLIYFHQDRVARLPEGAVGFAECDHCPEAGFTVGSHLVTFQGHPEFSAEFVRFLLTSRYDGMPEADRLAAIESLSQATHNRETALRMLSLHAESR